MINTVYALKALLSQALRRSKPRVSITITVFNPNNESAVRIRV